MPVPLRGDFEASRLRAFARKTKDAPQARRLLALAAIYDGASRTDAARIGGVTLRSGLVESVTRLWYQTHESAAGCGPATAPSLLPFWKGQLTCSLWKGARVAWIRGCRPITTPDYRGPRALTCAPCAFYITCPSLPVQGVGVSIRRHRRQCPTRSR